MARQRNPRRVVLAQMREMNTWLRYMISAWSVRSTVYDPADRPGLNAWLRPRRVDEYPENQREAWERLAQYMRAISTQAENIEAAARERIAAIDAETNSPEG